MACFGDQLNGLPMSAVADIARAVANAVPEVHAAATQVIGADTADGVARWTAATSATAAPLESGSRPAVR